MSSMFPQYKPGDEVVLCAVSPTLFDCIPLYTPYGKTCKVTEVRMGNTSDFGGAQIVYYGSYAAWSHSCQYAAAPDRLPLVANDVAGVVGEGYLKTQMQPWAQRHDVPFVCDEIRTDHIARLRRCAAYRRKMADVRRCLYDRLTIATQAQTGVRQWRFACYTIWSKSDYESTRRRYKERGRAVAQQLKKFNDTTLPDVERFAAACALRGGYSYRQDRSAALKEACRVAEVEGPLWHPLNGYSMNDTQQYTLLMHSPRPASDETKIAYYQSIDKMLNGVRTVTKPGRYLQKYFSDLLDEKKIKQLAEIYAAKHGPVTVHYIESDDPDGWEWVYEHGHGFSSCMVYDRDERYLDADMRGEDHPVRVYAYAGNGLRLAYIGDKYRPGHGGQVYARAIVYDPELDKFNDKSPDSKGVIRVYGDDRLWPLLREAGYANAADTEGVRLVRRMCGNNSLILPYLDGCHDRVDDCGDCLVLSGDGDICGDSSCGWVDVIPPCECTSCGGAVARDNTHTTADGDPVCEHCINNYYTYAVVDRHGDTGYIPTSGAVYVEVADEWYRDNIGVLRAHGIGQCECCEGYEMVEDMTSVVGDISVCEPCLESDYTELDVPHDGYNYAENADVVQAVRVATGETVVMHEDDVDGEVYVDELDYEETSDEPASEETAAC